MGMDLQLEELIEQRERARVQGRIEDAGSLEIEISALQVELVAAAERAAVEDLKVTPVPSSTTPRSSAWIDPNDEGAPSGNLFRQATVVYVASMAAATEPNTGINWSIPLRLKTLRM